VTRQVTEREKEEKERERCRRKREREEREREERMRKRKREARVDCGKARRVWGPKEVTKACRSVPSQKYHSGDATSNRVKNRVSESQREGWARRLLTTHRAQSL